VQKSVNGLRDKIVILDCNNKELGKTEEIDIVQQAVLVRSGEGNEIG